MSNSKAILLSLFLIFLSACSERTIDRDELVERNGVFYEKFSTEPFTGSVTGRTSGRMSKGLFNGLVTTFDEEGRLTSEYNLVNGVRDGDVTQFHPNGQLKSRGRFRDDLLEGALEVFLESGTLDATYNFVAGNRQGVANVYRESGEVWYSHEYSNDVFDGEYLEYFEGGSLKTRGTYREGFKFGKWEFFNGEGSKSDVEPSIINYLEATTENGEMAEFHENGFVKSAGLKKNGLRDGLWSFYDEEGELLRTVEYEDGKELTSSQ